MCLEKLLPLSLTVSLTLDSHNLPRSKRQNSYDLQQMKQGKNCNQKQVAISDQQQKIALLEKQLAWEKMRADTLDKMIDIAEKELNISIRKKPGNQQFNK